MIVACLGCVLTPALAVWMVNAWYWLRGVVLPSIRSAVFVANITLRTATQLYRIHRSGMWPLWEQIRSTDEVL